MIPELGHDQGTDYLLLHVNCKHVRAFYMVTIIAGATGSCDSGPGMLHILQSPGKLLTRMTCLSQNAQSTSFRHSLPDLVMLQHVHYNLHIYCLLCKTGSTGIITLSISLTIREPTHKESNSADLYL